MIMKYKVGDKVKFREDYEWDRHFHTGFQELDPPYVTTIIKAYLDPQEWY